MGRGGPSLGTAPLTSGRRRKGKQGGSEKGRTQKKKFPGYAKMRRRAVLSSFYFKQLDQLPRIPEMPKQGASSGAPHPARVIAAELTRPGETPPTTRWVYDLLCKIHRIGHEHYDPDTDGRSGERPGAQKLTAEDDPLLFEMRKKGSREEPARAHAARLPPVCRLQVGVPALRDAVAWHVQPVHSGPLVGADVRDLALGGGADGRSDRGGRGQLAAQSAVSPVRI